MTTNLKRMAGLAVAGFGMAAISGAQTNGPAGISARLGVTFPTSTIARDISNSWFAFGADYKLKNDLGTAGSGMPAYLSLSADYYSDGGFHSLPVALNYNIRQGQLVFAVGVGATWNHEFGNDVASLGEQVAVTYEFNRSGRTIEMPFFVQAKYFHSGNKDLDALGVYVGVRF